MFRATTCCLGSGRAGQGARWVGPLSNMAALKDCPFDYASWAEMNFYTRREASNGPGQHWHTHTHWLSQTSLSDIKMYVRNMNKT